jgi:ribosome-associated protein
MVRLDKVSRAAVDALEDVKARDIVVFDVKKMTAYFDKVIVATGDSNRHCRSLASRVQEQVKAAGGKIYGTEGEKTGEWLLVDIGAAVVHIMQPAIRQYYNLEELWAPVPKSAKPPKVAKSAKTEKSSKPGKPVKAAKLATSRKRAVARKAALGRSRGESA